MWRIEILMPLGAKAEWSVNSFLEVLSAHTTFVLFVQFYSFSRPEGISTCHRECGELYDLYNQGYFRAIHVSHGANNIEECAEEVPQFGDTSVSSRKIHGRRTIQ